MNNITKQIIISHLNWIENGMTKQEIHKSYNEVKSKDIFGGVHMKELQENLGHGQLYKDDVLTSDYDKITFLWANLSIEKIDLSFLKYCTNLEEINIGCYNEINLDALNHNTKLKTIIANGNNINNIEALHNHKDLEYLNIENNPCCSLEPIAHFKNIKKIEVDLIANEIDALYVLNNNSICTLNYLIKGGETDFDKFIFPFFHVIITKNLNQIKISIEGIKIADKFTTALAFPIELATEEAFVKKYYAKAKTDLISRLKLITGEDVVLNIKEIMYYQDFYMIEYIHKL
jgi:hypothetical protein